MLQLKLNHISKTGPWPPRIKLKPLLWFIFNSSAVNLLLIEYYVKYELSLVSEIARISKYVTRLKHHFIHITNERSCDITYHGRYGNNLTISILRIKVITAHNILWIYTNGNPYRMTLSIELFSNMDGDLLLYSHSSNYCILDSQILNTM